MRTLRHKLGFRRGDPDRHSFGFFVVATLVLIGLAFFLGFQLGRYVEKGAARTADAGNPPRGTAAENGALISSPAQIRKDLSAFSEEAVKIPAVAPPTAVDDLKKTEAEVTYPDTLSRRDPSPDPMGKKGKPTAVTPTGKARFLLQAGAMKSRETAEALRKRLVQGGYKAKVIHATTRKHGEVFRVRIGPFDSREEAAKAMKTIRSGMKIDVFLLKG